MWVLVGDSTESAKMRLGTLAWNMLVAYYSWWLFGFEVFELLHAVLVAVVLMASTSCLRRVDPESVRARLPSRDRVEEFMPTREQLERWAAQVQAAGEATLAATKE